MRKALLVACLVICSFATINLIWAYDRLLEKCWIEYKGFPFPDHWMARLNQWYDERYPVPLDRIKLHAEVARVGATIMSLLTASAMLTGYFAWQLVSRRYAVRFSLRVLLVVVILLGCLCWLIRDPPYWLMRYPLHTKWTVCLESLIFGCG